MPTYEYKCPECNHVMDIMHKMNEQPPTICPKCMVADMRKGIGGGISFHLEGPGFYQNDYKGKS